MNRTEKLVAELERLKAQEKDHVLRGVLAHLIEQVPDEVAFQEEGDPEPDTYVRNV